MIKTPVNQKNLSVINQAKVLQTICLSDTISRAEIARQTGLTAMTVSNIVNGLINAGIVYERQDIKGESDLGRKPKILDIAETSPCIIGLNLARGSVSAILCDYKARIIHKTSKPVHQLNGADEMFQMLIDTCRQLMRQTNRKIIAVGKNYFEINAQINSQDGLCYFIEGQLKGCLVNKVEGSRVYPNKMDNFKKGMTIYRNFDAKFEKQLSNSKTKRRISAKFLYNEGVLHAIDEDGNEVAMEVLANEKPKNPDKMQENFISQLKKCGESDFYITEIKINDEIPFLPVSEINNLRREILDKLMEERLNNYERDVQQPMYYAEFPVKDLDYRANIHNHEAKSFYENCSCKSCEMSYESTRPQNVELMRTKHCLKFAFNMCKSPVKLFLIDEKGKKYPLMFDCKNCEMIVCG